jgi:hypothetical protein
MTSREPVLWGLDSLFKEAASVHSIISVNNAMLIISLR